ncbi:hypothetical protein F8M41_016511 [Gigaspora margarita]|uniref:Uncharacterized protein n=1 Tax=Gigaspora margarita TaxID=4874 RepID=A0A8H4EMU9_GIGMA|nr:hypothetical protein F8M41_016511 [Gigaspora margarita]
MCLSPAVTVTKLGLELDLELEEGLLYNKTPQEAFLARKNIVVHSSAIHYPEYADLPYCEIITGKVVRFWVLKSTPGQLLDKFGFAIS